MNMHAAMKNLGGTALLRCEQDLRVPVRLADVKPGWGTFRYLVEPVGGMGEQWVDESRLTFEKQREEV